MASIRYSSSGAEGAADHEMVTWSPLRDALTPEAEGTLPLSGIYTCARRTAPASPCSSMVEAFTQQAQATSSILIRYHVPSPVMRFPSTAASASFLKRAPDERYAFPGPHRQKAFISDLAVGISGVGVSVGVAVASGVGESVGVGVLVGVGVDVSVGVGVGVSVGVGVQTAAVIVAISVSDGKQAVRMKAVKTSDGRILFFIFPPNLPVQLTSTIA